MIFENSELNTVLTNSFKTKAGNPPSPGDLLTWEEDLYQYRLIKPYLKWNKVCSLQQLNLDDKDAIVWDVGETMVVADQANLLAVIISISTYDPRSNMEDLVKTIFRLFKESGWIQTRGGMVNGIVHLESCEGGVEIINTTDIDQVFEQIRSGTPFVEIPENGTTKVINFKNYKSMSIDPIKEKDDSN